MAAMCKLTARGPVWVPAEIRKKLGVGPGSALEWEERNGEIVVRRAKRYTSLEIHTASFEDDERAPERLTHLKAGVRSHTRKKQSRR